MGEGVLDAVLQVKIVQQGAWATPLPAMPLAAGYLKATALSDEHLKAHAEIEIVNLDGGIDVREAAAALFAGSPPDVLAFSVLGWNVRTFGALATTFKQLQPDGLVVFGGNHVSHQGQRVFDRFDAVDVVVNGEGEQTFAELLRWRMEGGTPEDLAQVAGLSFRPGRLGPRRLLPGGARVLTTDERARSGDLDQIPSPLLSGALPLLDGNGGFPYEVALVETNRGCPYRCSFCYWGGAVGARVHEFSRQRLRAELELLGAHGVETVVLCDANFGLRAADLDFVEDLLDTRDRHGAPRYLEASWAKNKSAVFYEIVETMAREGLSSSFTLALQSLGVEALESMGRRNMQINEWEEVARFLQGQGLDCYAELIWGAPGESAASFLAGYDRLARTVPRIAVYPLLVLPNTAYDEARGAHGLVTVLGQDDDYEYVLAHDQLSVEENLEVQQLVFWARVLAENALLRWSWRALALVDGLTQSGVIGAFAGRLDASDTSLAVELRSVWRPFAESRAIVRALRLLHRSDGMAWELLEGWWEEEVVARARRDIAPFLREVLRYDWLTRPVYVEPEEPHPLPVVDLDGVPHYRRPRETFSWDVPAVLGPPLTDPLSQARRCEVDVVAKVGFYSSVENHELAIHHVGRPLVAASVDQP